MAKNNSYGHYSQDGTGYIVPRPDAPRPWMSYTWRVPPRHSVFFI